MSTQSAAMAASSSSAVRPSSASEVGIRHPPAVLDDPPDEELGVWLRRRRSGPCPRSGPRTRLGRARGSRAAPSRRSRRAASPSATRSRRPVSGRAPPRRSAPARPGRRRAPCRSGTRGRPCSYAAGKDSTSSASASRAALVVTGVRKVDSSDSTAWPMASNPPDAVTDGGSPSSSSGSISTTRGTRWACTNIRLPPSCHSIATAVDFGARAGSRRDGDDRWAGHDVRRGGQPGGEVEGVGERDRRQLRGVQGTSAADCRRPRRSRRSSAGSSERTVSGVGSAATPGPTRTLKPALSSDVAAVRCSPRPSTALSATSSTAPWAGRTPTARSSDAQSSR